MQDAKVTPFPSTPSKNYKILIVEDEPDARELFVELLSTEGKYEVQSAVDGEDALTKAAGTKFDLILLDIVMPVKDGIETLDDILKGKEKYGEPTVIMLTNIGGDLAIEKAMEMGAAGYKLKIDTDPEELLKFVEETLNKRAAGLPITSAPQAATDALPQAA